MDLFHNCEPEEFLLFVQNFKMTPDALETLSTNVKIHYLRTILRGVELHQFDSLCAHVAIVTIAYLNRVVLGLGT